MSWPYWVSSEYLQLQPFRWINSQQHKTQDSTIKLNVKSYRSSKSYLSVYLRLNSSENRIFKFCYGVLFPWHCKFSINFELRETICSASFFFFWTKFQSSIELMLLRGTTLVGCLTIYLRVYIKSLWMTLVGDSEELKDLC